MEGSKSTLIDHFPARHMRRPEIGRFLRFNTVESALPRRMRGTPTRNTAFHMAAVQTAGVGGGLKTSTVSHVDQVNYFSLNL